MNLGFAGLALIPGAASYKIGAKSAKVVAEAAKVAKVANEAKYGIKEGKAV